MCRNSLRFKKFRKRLLRASWKDSCSRRLASKRARTSTSKAAEATRPWPDDATKLFPKQKPPIDKCAPRLGELQVTVDTKPADANFEPKPWDVDIKEKTRAFSDKA